MKISNIFESGNKRILIVCGNLCSGKGYFCSQNLGDYHRITVSDVVRELSNMKNRSELSTTASFDKQILARLIVMIEDDPRDAFVIDGIRQLSILQGLKQHFGDQIKHIAWLDTPDDVAKERFLKRGSSKDNIDYETARQGDRDLGIEDVEKYIRANHVVIPH